MRYHRSLYVFGTTAASVFQPAVDTSRWTSLTPFPTVLQRFFGATAIVNEMIYCIGGLAPRAPSSGRISNIVNIFNTTSRTWSTGVPMTSGRQGHAASSYNGKVYVFGGRTAANIVLRTVEEFDPVTGQWTTKAPMPEAWDYMSTGAMPAYNDGTVDRPPFAAAQCQT
jgi:N-acetylneuraminic acid mutarotase